MVTIQLPPLHDAQMEIAQCPARFRVVACGRQFGKTQLAAVECVVVAAQGGKVWAVAPDYERNETLYNVIRTLSLQIPGVKWIKSRNRLEFPGGGMIQVKTADNPLALVGTALDFLVLEEQALMHPLAWETALPATLVAKQGRALFISSPRGRNQFWELYTQCKTVLESEGTGKQNWQRYERETGFEGWAAFRFPTADNPFIPPSEIERERVQRPDTIFQQDFMARFTDDASSVFRGVHDVAVLTDWDTIGPANGHVYVGGIDWGRDQDFTVFALFDATERRMVALDIFNKVGWDLQLGRVKGLHDRWHPAKIYGEQNSIGAANIEALQNAGLPVFPFNMSGLSKGPLIDAWALALETAQVTVFKNPDLIQQHLIFDREYLPSGAVRYGAPRHQHDDIVIASALGWHAVREMTDFTPGIQRVSVSGLYGRREEVSQPRLIRGYSTKEKALRRKYR
jgi:hypothetical protein